MNRRSICSALILGGLMVTLAPLSSPLAQLSDKNVVAPKDAGAAPAKAKTNTTTPTKQPRWRHRGGKHPHFGSRPVRT